VISIINLSKQAILIAAVFPGLLFAQQAAYSTLQDVKPPSPEAISIARQDFADVSLYTGKLNYGIPLYTISQNGISVPISLNYSGGGGIKVEEIASSVGLGWSLQSTGVITRSIRGMADDAANIGYLHLPGFDSTIFAVSEQYPTHPDWSFYHNNYRLGKYDAQPDIYYLSAPGLSAMFYINKFKHVVFVEKSDLKVKINFHTSYSTISGFDVIDLNGNTYVFDEIETSRSVSLTSPSPSWYNENDASAWYLSKIMNSTGNVIFNFEYEEPVETFQLLRAPYQYTVLNQISSSPEPFTEDNSTYTELYNSRPLLKKISTASIEVDFVMSTAKRNDLWEGALDSIVVRNFQGQTIKKVHFNYSYFSSSGVVQHGILYNDPSLRLKLDTVEIIGNDNYSKQVYGFAYNTNHLLPNRITTFAMDHWGFYNGQISNTTWEAKHRELYYDFPGTFPAPPLVRLAEFGSANREPNDTYAQACILKEVTTPLGGRIQFEYEGNTSNDPRLPNTISVTPLFTAAYEPDNQKQYFHIDMIREPFSYVRLMSPISSGVKIEYTLRDSLESTQAIIDTLEEGNSNHTHKLPNGVYYLKARIINYSSDPSYFYTISLSYETETPVVNKPVGGVRIKRMKLIDPLSNETYIRDYYYNEEGNSTTSSPSTGVISRPPTYGHQFVQLFGNEYIETASTLLYATAHGYVRQLSSTYPLISSGGGYVGYTKVTTVDSDSLKSEYHFTSFKEFPQWADGYYEYTGTNSANLEFTSGGGHINGKWYEIFPFAPDDERDYFRGKLTKEVHYKRESGVFKKISVKENDYIFNYGIVISKDKIAIQPDSIINSNLFLPDTYRVLPREVIEGVVFAAVGSCECSVWKRYRLHTGKYDLNKTTQKTFTYTGELVDSLVFESTMEYGHAPWYKDSLYHYVVTKTIQETNTGADTTFLYYPFDWRYTVPEIMVSDTSYLRQLERQNRIGVPVIEKKTNNDGLHISTVKNQYGLFNSIGLYPGLVQVKTGWATSFEDIISFNTYDTLGNILEQQKVDDILQSYIWGYKQTYPIAMVSNASSTEIAYTSFEEEGWGNWNNIISTDVEDDTTSPTGRNKYLLSSGISKSGLSTTSSYIVSYWKESGTVNVNGMSATRTGDTINGWTYCEHLVANPVLGEITVSGINGVIDELRLYPADAQMISYTYIPGIGIASMTDANNVTSYYEYDSFGRLKLIQDDKGNVLQHYTYNYKQH
jgi:hypothetical protein